MKSPSTSPQAVKFNLNCSRQAHFNGPDIGPGYKNTEPGSIFTILCIYFMVCPPRSAMPSPQGCLKDSAQLAQTDVRILVSFGEHLRTHIKNQTRYDQGPEIHSRPRRMLLFSEAQLAGYLKVWVSAPLK